MSFRKSFITKKLLQTLHAICFIYITSCSLPTDEETVRWNFSATVPLANELTHLWEPIDTAISDMNSGSSSGSTELLTSDILTILRKDTIETSMDMESFFVTEPSSESQSMGEVTIEDLDTVTVPMFPIPGETLSKDGKSITILLPIISDKFETLFMSEQSPALEFTLRNNSTVNTIKSSSVTLFTNDTEIVGGAAQNCLPLNSKTISLPMNNILISIEASELLFVVEFESPIGNEDLAQLEFSFNDQIIQSGRVSSELFSDSITIDMTKDFTDSLQVDSVKFNSLGISCELSNTLGLDAKLQASFINGDSTIITPFWDLPQLLPIDNSSIPSQLDSFSIYPIWNDSLQKSEINLSFTIYPNRAFGMVNFDSKNGLELEFTMGEKRFNSVSGRFVNDLIEVNEAEKWDFPDVIADDIRDEVVEKLRIEGSMMTSSFVAEFDSSASIDSVELQINTLFGSDSSQVKTTDHFFPFIQIEGGVFNSLEMDSDIIINSLPENIQSGSSVTIPKGTKFHIVTVNDALTIPFTLYIDFAIPLHFTTTESVGFVSEVNVMDIPSDATQAMKALENANATIDLTYSNFSSVELKVFGVMSNYTDLDTLQSIPSHNFTPEYFAENSMDDFYMITGGKYQRLRISDSDTTLQWSIGDRALNVFADNEKVCMKVRVQLPEGANMIIDTTSALAIKTAISISGVARSDFMKEID